MNERSIDAATQQVLEKYGFVREDLEHFATLLAAPAGLNHVTGSLELPHQEDASVLPKLGTPERRELTALGTESIRRGEVGIVCLAGGMATRFGGVVKAAVPVVEEATFLELKLRDVARMRESLHAAIPAYLMSSFATHERLVELVTKLNDKATEVFPQFVSLRLSPDGALFREADGELSPYATGHGDLTFALRRQGLLTRFQAQGGRYLYMSNIDNLGATLDPAVIGAHIKGDVAITCEVVRKLAGDKGGAPARLDGRPQIVEAFRFPPTFNQDTIPVFNTNSFVLSAKDIDREFDLTFFRVEKKVEGRVAIQFERLVGELTAYLSTHFLEVDREGPDARFLPVKDPEELEARRGAIREVLKSRGIYG